MKRALFATLAALAWITGVADATAREKHRRLASYEPRIICGQTGCFEIPRGCTGEVRRSGKGVVAVVWCDKK